EQGCPGIAQGTADDEHTAARLLPRILRQWFERGADDASVERRRPRALGQRSPTATATARSRICEIETDRGVLSPIASRRASARLLRRRVVSMRSMPPPELKRETRRASQGGGHGWGGCARAAGARGTRHGEGAGQMTGWGGRVRRARAPEPGTGPAVREKRGS